MTPKLKVIPLGGLGEIGKNMTVVEFGNDMIVIDCGMGHPVKKSCEILICKSHTSLSKRL